MSKQAGEEFLLASEVSAICIKGGVPLSPARVRQLERAGELPAMKTSTGWRLFSRRDVEAFLRKRVQG